MDLEVKTNYIKINSKNDLDLKKIKIGELNNRYIDTDGRRYATRFNVRTKKIELIRIALGLEEAKEAVNEYKKSLIAKVKQVNLNTKSLEDGNKESTNNKASNQQVNDVNNLNLKDTFVFNVIMQDNKWLYKNNIAVSFDNINNVYYTDLLDKLLKFKEQTYRLILSFKNLEHTSQKSSQNTIATAMDIYDHELHNNFEEAHRYYIEFQKYPKKPEYYISLLSTPLKKKIETLYNDEQMKFFKIYICFNFYLKMFYATLQIIQLIEKEISYINQTDMNNKQAYDDILSLIKYNFEELKIYVNQVFFWAKNENLFSI